MKVVYLCLISSLLMACQPTPVNQANQQQSFVCKSLIEGFLKTQQLGQYELRSIEPKLDQTAAERTYVYKTASDVTMRVNAPVQPDLAFRCQQHNSQFAVQLIDAHTKDTLPLLSLNLPAQQTMRVMTAYQAP